MKKIGLLIICIFILTGCSSENKYKDTINVLNWSSYIPTEVIEDFEKEYNIKVNYSTYSSNEELLAKVASVKEGTYDLVFPSDYMVELMKEKDLLEELDINRLSNYGNIDRIFLNQDYDYFNKYSLPFLMTYVVMAVDRSKIGDDINSYSDLLNVSYKNNIVTLDDQRIVIGTGLMAVGEDMNSLGDNNYDVTKEFLLNLKKNIKAFDSDSPKSLLITDEVDIGVMWSAEAVLAKQYNNNIEIIIPSDGYAISMDNYCILKNSKNFFNAYKLIDYLLRVDVNKRIIESYPYVSSISVNNNYNNNYIENILSNGKYVKNIGYNVKYYDGLWAEIK